MQILCLVVMPNCVILLWFYCVWRINDDDDDDDDGGNLSSRGVEFGLVYELGECGEQRQQQTGEQNVEDSGHVRQLETARRLLLSTHTTRWRFSAVVAFGVESG